MNALDTLDLVGIGGLTAMFWFALLHGGIIFYSLFSGKRFTTGQTVGIIVGATAGVATLSYLAGATVLAIGVACGALAIPALHGIAYLVDGKKRGS